jgi:hypothetical protein
MLLRQAMALLGTAQQWRRGEQPPALDDELGRRLAQNAKTISDDATSDHPLGDGHRDKVSNVVGTVAGRLESPVIRAAGALAGVAAGLRSVRTKKEVVVDHDAKVVRRKRGLFR